MKAKKQKPQKQSAPETSKREKREIEFVFGLEPDNKSDADPATSTGESAQAGKKRKPRRVIFRF